MIPKKCPSLFDITNIAVYPYLLAGPDKGMNKPSSYPGLRTSSAVLKTIKTSQYQITPSIAQANPATRIFGALFGPAKQPLQMELITCQTLLLLLSKVPGELNVVF